MASVVSCPLNRLMAIGVCYTLSIWLATVDFFVGLACLIGTLITFIVMLRMEVMGKEDGT